MNRRVTFAEAPWGPRDADAIKSLFESGMLTQGVHVSRFERAFHGFLGAAPNQDCLMVNSGSSANLLAAALLRHHLDEVGDTRREVLMPALTWSTTVAPFLQHGFKPVFVDVAPDGMLDPNLLAAASSQDTVGVALVHLLGYAANLDMFRGICKFNNWFLFEDCCEAFGTQWDEEHVGVRADLASYSTYMSHQASTVEGGMLLHGSGHLARGLREHGWVRDYPEPLKASLRAQCPGVDDRWMFDSLGYNVRATEFQGLLGGIALNQWAAMRAKRLAHTARLESSFVHEALAGYPVDSRCTPNPFAYPVLFKSDAGFGAREAIQYISSCGVDTRPVISGNITRHPWYQRHPGRYRVGSELLWTDYWHSQGLLLPNGPHLVEDDLQRIIQALGGFLKEKTGEGLSW